MLVASARCASTEGESPGANPMGTPAGHPGFLAVVQAGARFNFAADAGPQTRILTTSTRGAFLQPGAGPANLRERAQRLPCIDTGYGGIAMRTTHFMLAASIVTLLSLIYVGLTLAADLANAWLDPRIRVA